VISGWLQRRREAEHDRFSGDIAPEVLDADAARDVDVDLGIIDEGLWRAGTRTMTAEALARFLQVLLDVPFEPRRSGFVGDYYRAIVGDERFSVEPNADDDRDEDELLEPEFPEDQVLLYVDRTERAGELEAKFTTVGDLKLLRRGRFCSPNATMGA
jgi:hypothetical protein